MKPGPVDFFSHLPDLAVLTLVPSLLLFSLTATAFILHFHLRTARSRRLHNLNSLWAVRALLIAFACLWSLTELLRLPLLRRLPPLSRLPAADHLALCRVYVLASQAFAEPCFFATLLFLLRRSLRDDHKTAAPRRTAFATALLVALLSSLPLLVLQSLFLSATAAWALRKAGVPPEVFGRTGALGSDGVVWCSYPLGGTLLLAGFGAVYVPCFVSVCWRAVSVVINKTLRVRLYALASAVVVALSVQVMALALSALWGPGQPAFQGLAVTAFLAVFVCALVGEGMLVVRPIADALAVGGTSLVGAGSGESEARGWRGGDDGVGGC